MGSYCVTQVTECLYIISEEYVMLPPFLGGITSFHLLVLPTGQKSWYPLPSHGYQCVTQAGPSGEPLILGISSELGMTSGE